MHNLALIFVALTAQSRRQCPCGAVAERPFGLCRKCQARNAWRRKTTPARRKAARRRLTHRVRNFVRLLVGEPAFFATVSTGVEG
jgi:hypothetical protein